MHECVCVCVCVWRELNAEHTLAMSKLMHALLMCFLILGQECRLFMVSVAVVGVLQEGGKHIS